MKAFVTLVGLLLVVILPGIGECQTANEVLGFSGNLQSNGGAMTLTQGRDGKLHGTTSGFDRTTMLDGTLFQVSTGGKVTTLHSFGGADGAFPIPGLTLAIDGNFYGTTVSGGSVDRGVLFKITTSGTYTLLHQFTGGADGQTPAQPIQASDGNLYGATYSGTGPGGTIYKYSPSTGNFATILTLAQDGSQGNQITSPLVQASDGSLYGVAAGYGANGCGTIFRLSTAGTLLSVYSFPCGAGGSTPYGALIQASDGNLYGITAAGGTMTSKGECQSGCGTVFQVSHGIVSILYRFAGYPSDGALALAGLVQGTDGNLYGGTDKGGINDLGVLYQITLSGQYKLLYSFAQRIGAGANAALMQHTNGKFYGNASFGGRDSEGAIYSLDMGLGPFVALVRYTGRIGQPVQILGQGLTGSTAVTINGVAATTFKVVSDTYMTAVVPTGATTGPVVVTTATGTLTSNHNFRIVQ